MTADLHRYRRRPLRSRIERWWRYNWLPTVILLLAAYAFVGNVVQKSEMYDHCIADGHRDYQCHAIVFADKR